MGGNIKVDKEKSNSNNNPEKSNAANNKSLINDPLIILGILALIVAIFTLIATIISPFFFEYISDHNKKIIIEKEADDLWNKVNLSNNQAESLLKQGKIDLAIDKCEAEIKGYNISSEKIMPELRLEYAKIQNTLGKAYLMRSDDRYSEGDLNRSLELFNISLRIRSQNENSTDYAETVDNRGLVYRDLSKIRNKKANSERALWDFNETLNLWKNKNNTINYAHTIGNQGTAFFESSKVQNKKSNLNAAINAYSVALGIYRIRNSTNINTRYNIAIIENNLGNAYRSLSEVENRSANLDKSIEHNSKALGILKELGYSNEYALAQHNKGIALCSLSEVRDAEYNLDIAINTFKESLNKAANNEFNYAEIQNSLGVAYISLSKVVPSWDSKNELYNAIHAFNIALKTRTYERYPLDYAETQNNLGVAYCYLSKIENSQEDIIVAIKAFNNASLIRTYDDYPLYYAETEQNLGLAYTYLADFMDKRNNLEIALNNYKYALDIWKKEGCLIDYANTCQYLGNAYVSLSQTDSKYNSKYKYANDIYEACLAYNDALYVFNEREYPMQHLQIEQSLNYINATLM